MADKCIYVSPLSVLLIKIGRCLHRFNCDPNLNSKEAKIRSSAIHALASTSRRNLETHSKNKTPVLGSAIPVLGVKPKRGCHVYCTFFKIGLCSATSCKRSRRELSIDVTERSSILKNNQNTDYPRFRFTPKTRNSLERVFCFHCVIFCRFTYRLLDI